jgi:hypothetical protein
MRLAPVVLLVLTLTACSGDEPVEPPVPLPSETATATPSPTASPSAQAAPQIEGLEVLAEDPSHDHVDGPVEYDRTPPLGGPHNVRWLACDVYDEPVPAELAVHSIEHGAVWLAHDPELPEAQRAALAQLAATDPEYVLVAPQDGLDSRVVAVTWGAALEASSADDPRLAAFVEAYAGGGQGGEPGAPCRTGGLGLEQARAALGG